MLQFYLLPRERILLCLLLTVYILFLLSICQLASDLENLKAQLWTEFLLYNRDYIGVRRSETKPENLNREDSAEVSSKLSE